MGRVVFVNRFYWPETPATAQLMTDLASGLADMGWEVLVIASGRSGIPRKQEQDGVTIVRINSPRLSPTTAAGKSLSFAAFAAGAGWVLLRHVRRGDVVVCLTDPPLLGIAATWIARMKAARIVHWVQDVYPEIAIALTGHRWLGAAKLLRNRSWRDADHCVVLSSEMADVARAAGAAGERIAVIPNWAPAGLTPQPLDDPQVRRLRDRWGLDGRFVVEYSGNLGRVHDLEPVIDAADLLRGDERVAFALVGGGAQHEKLAAAVRHRGLSNIHFLPPQPREELGATLGVGHVHLVTVRPGCERFVFPSKLYGIAAVGRPVIAVGPHDCELARMVVGAGIGMAVDRDQPEALAAAVRELAASPARVAEYVDASLRFSGQRTAQRAVQRWNQLLQSVETC
jgi:glycosyltransferase involved in cell wall biosynthesis